MRKKPLLIFGIVFILGVVFFIPTKKTKITIPYPYKLPLAKKQKVDYNAVWIGPLEAKKAAIFLPNLQKRLERGGQNFKIKDLSQEHLGLHRIVHKLRSLSPFPEVIYYYGNSQEASEVRFDLKDLSPIRENLKLFSEAKDKKNINFKKYLRPISLKEQKVNTLELNPEQKAAFLATLYALYEVELKELVQLAHKNNSRLVLVTSPIKLKDAQVENCSAYSRKLHLRLDTLYRMIEKQRFKKAYQISKGLLLRYFGYAEIYYVHALISEGLKKYSEALEFFNKAQAYNCNLYTPKPVLNQIMKTVAKKFNLSLFDFDSYLQEKFILDPSLTKTFKIKKKHYKTLIQTLEFITLTENSDT